MVVDLALTPCTDDPNNRSIATCPRVRIECIGAEATVQPELAAGRTSPHALQRHRRLLPHLYSRVGDRVRPDHCSASKMDLIGQINFLSGQSSPSGPLLLTTRGRCHSTTALRGPLGRISVRRVVSHDAWRRGPEAEKGEKNGVWSVCRLTWATMSHSWMIFEGTCEAPRSLGTRSVAEHGLGGFLQVTICSPA